MTMIDTNKIEKQLIKKRYIKHSTTQSTSKWSQFFNRLFKKNQTQSIDSWILDVLPYEGFAGKEQFIRLKDEFGFVEILQLQGYNLQGMSHADIELIIYQYEVLSKLYVLPFKMVTMYTPMDTSVQQEYYKRLAEQTQDLTYKELLMTQYFEMKHFEENNYTKEFFVFLYGDTVQELREYRQDFLMYSRSLHFFSVSKKKKTAILFRLNNPTSQLALMD